MLTRTHNSGFGILDVMVGLGLVAALSVALTSVVAKQNNASARLAESRQALRLAERVLSELQSGTVGVEVEENQNAAVAMESIAQAAAPKGRKWVRVAVTLGGSKAELFGLAPVSTPDRQPATRGAP